MAQVSWRITLLGGLRVQDREGAAVHPGNGRLLGLLALRQPAPRTPNGHKGGMIRREELLELLWPDVAPDQARNALRVALTRLRRLLNGEEVVLAEDSEHTWIGLNRDAIVTDVAEFRAALEGAQRAREPEAVARSLQAAVDLYAGDLLPEYGEPPFIEARAALQAEYLEALRGLIAYNQANAHWPEVAQLARRILRCEELDEAACLSLLNALLAAGNRRGAQHEYQRFHARLLAEQIEPGADFQQLGTLLHIRPAPTRPAPTRPEPIRPKPNGSRSAPQSPPTPGPHSPAAHLPADPHPFFGRDRELARLSQWLIPVAASEQVQTAQGAGSLAIRGRLVTLVGLGGMGKTRLAIEAARRQQPAFEDRVWFVPLEAVRHPDLLLRAIAEGLKLPPSKEVDGQIVAFLRARPALLLLDNFETVMLDGEEGAPQQVHWLLARLPQLTCLVTSRLRLAVEGERVVELRPFVAPTREELRQRGLAANAALALYADRACAVRPDFKITPDNVKAVLTLCRRLEGIPLAIVLAASWARTLTPAQSLQQLRDRFALLRSRQAGETDRRGSLLAVLTWTFDRLAPDLQRFFARLSVFRGGWTLEAAAEVAGNNTPVFSWIDELLELSMLLSVETADGMRYGMLETLREYAAGQLQARGEQETTEAGHRNHYLVLAEAAAAALNGPHQQAWMDRLEREHDNLRAALDTAMRGGAGETALRLAVALGEFWETRAHLTEGHERFTDLLKRFPGRSSLHVRALNADGWLLFRRGLYLEALARFEQSLELAESLGDTEWVAKSLRAIGNVRHRQNLIPEAQELHNRSLALCRQLGHKQGMASALNGLALASRRLGEMEAARQQHLESLALYREIGHLQGEASALNNLGVLEAWVASRIAHGDVTLREYQMACTYQEQSLTLARQLGAKQLIAAALLQLAWLAVRRDDDVSILSYLKECLPLLLSFGEFSLMGECFLIAARLYYERGNADERGAFALFFGQELYRRSGVSIPDFVINYFEHLDPMRVDPARSGSIARASEIAGRTEPETAILLVLDDTRPL